MSIFYILATLGCEILNLRDVMKNNLRFKNEFFILQIFGASPNRNQMPRRDSPEMSGIHVDSDSAKENLKAMHLETDLGGLHGLFILRLIILLFTNRKHGKRSVCNLSAILSTRGKVRAMSAQQTLPRR